MATSGNGIKIKLLSSKCYKLRAAKNYCTSTNVFPKLIEQSGCDGTPKDAFSNLKFDKEPVKQTNENYASDLILQLNNLASRQCSPRMSEYPAESSKSYKEIYLLKKLYCPEKLQKFQHVKNEFLKPPEEIGKMHNKAKVLDKHVLNRASISCEILPVITNDKLDSQTKTRCQSQDNAAKFDVYVSSKSYKPKVIPPIDFSVWDESKSTNKTENNAINTVQLHASHKILNKLRQRKLNKCNYVSKYFSNSRTSLLSSSKCRYKSSFSTIKLHNITSISNEDILLSRMKINNAIQYQTQRNYSKKRNISPYDSPYETNISEDCNVESGYTLQPLSSPRLSQLRSWIKSTKPVFNTNWPNKTNTLRKPVQSPNLVSPELDELEISDPWKSLVNSVAYSGLVLHEMKHLARTTKNNIISTKKAIYIDKRETDNKLAKNVLHENMERKGQYTNLSNNQTSQKTKSLLTDNKIWFSSKFRPPENKIKHNSSVTPTSNKETVLQDSNDTYETIHITTDKTQQQQQRSKNLQFPNVNNQNELSTDKKNNNVNKTNENVYNIYSTKLSEKPKVANHKGEFIKAISQSTIEQQQKKTSNPNLFIEILLRNKSPDVSKPDKDKEGSMRPKTVQQHTDKRSYKPSLKLGKESYINSLKSKPLRNKSKLPLPIHNSQIFNVPTLNSETSDDLTVYNKTSFNGITPDSNAGQNVYLDIRKQLEKAHYFPMLPYKAISYKYKNLKKKDVSQNENKKQSPNVTDLSKNYMNMKRDMFFKAPKGLYNNALKSHSDSSLYTKLYEKQTLPEINFKFEKSDTINSKPRNSSNFVPSLKGINKNSLPDAALNFHSYVMTKNRDTYANSEPDKKSYVNTHSAELNINPTSQQNNRTKENFKPIFTDNYIKNKENKLDVSKSRIQQYGTLASEEEVNKPFVSYFKHMTQNNARNNNNRSKKLNEELYKSIYKMPEPNNKLEPSRLTLKLKNLDKKEYLNSSLSHFIKKQKEETVYKSHATKYTAEYYSKLDTDVFTLPRHKNVLEPNSKSARKSSTDVKNIDL